MTKFVCQYLVQFPVKEILLVISRAEDLFDQICLPIFSTMPTKYNADHSCQNLISSVSSITLSTQDVLCFLTNIFILSCTILITTFDASSQQHLSIRHLPQFPQDPWSTRTCCSSAHTWLTKISIMIIKTLCTHYTCSDLTCFTLSRVSTQDEGIRRSSTMKITSLPARSNHDLSN